MNSFGIRSGYKIRETPEYFPDVQADEKIWQQDIYKTAAILAWKFGATQLIDVGCGHADKLMQYAGEFETIGIDYGENIAYCRDKYPDKTWFSIDIEAEPIPVYGYGESAVIICSDVIEHLKDPTALIETLKIAAVAGATVVLSTPDRQRWHGYDHNGIPANPAHVREWTLSELVCWLAVEGLPIAWAGWTRSNNVDTFMNTCMVILSQNEIGQLPLNLEQGHREHLNTRPDVSVLIPCYNAAKTIEKAISSAFNQCGVSVEVVVCDDASTDESRETVAKLFERYPTLTTVLHGQNQGLAAALNSAAQAANGRYFIELDADDWLEPCSLKRMVEALDNNPEYGFAYGQTQYHGLSDYLHIPQVYKDNLFCFGFDSLYAFMYRREAWECGCKYRTTCEIGGKRITIQDWDMVLQLVYHMRYKPLVFRDLLVLNYNHVHGSLTDFTNDHNGQVVRAFRERWPILVIERV